ncbi:MAG TPA: CoA transferase [Chloroflexi bacterium]|jgi:crotonobetainyl-CoA:carnitine CoA-transferase CaiB-like acyl-CoA transferase|nr:CoA transferase [Chloroflexota bacterium]HAL27298.1 CoA transferase [Chloroflexota bacterium]
MTEIATRLSAPARAGALTGLRVVEMGFAAAGPLVGKYLANFGAEVIRLESRLAADVFRTTYPPFKDDVVEPDRAGMFAFYNDGKRSATLNLKHPKGAALARALIGRADVFVESFTPGTVARLGVGAETLRADHPELIVLSSCNQGQTGPHAFHPGYGSQLSALAGFVHLLGEPDSTPVLLYGPYIDYVAVGYGAIAVLAALERRTRTGIGCTIDLSQYEAGLQFLTPSILEFAANGRIPGRAGNADAVAAPHGVYRCAGADRWVALSVWSEAEWRALCDLMDLSGPPTLSGRRAARAELDAAIGRWTATRERDDVVALLRRAGVRAAPVLSISELFSDPQLAHRGMWPAVTHPAIGAMHVMAPPFRLSATPSLQERPGPTVGADNDHVFGEILGLSLDERRTLERDGVFE